MASGFRSLVTVFGCWIADKEVLPGSHQSRTLISGINITHVFSWHGNQLKYLKGIKLLELHFDDDLVKRLL